MNPTPDRTAWLQGGDAYCSHPPQPLPRAWRLVLLGPPGCGKGTQAALLAHSLGACTLSTGDILRAARSSPAPVGSAMAEAQACLNHGRLVPDSTMVELLAARRHCLRCHGGFLLDGYPRSLGQALELDDLLAQESLRLDAVIHYEVANEVLVSRLSGRRSCPACHATYHVTHRPPHTRDRCDHCLIDLVTRADDHLDAIRNRLVAYRDGIDPILALYRQRNQLLTVNAEGDAGDILAHTLDALAPLVLGR